MNADDKLFPNNDEGSNWSQGLSVRDHIAIEAMKPLLANWAELILCKNETYHLKVVADSAYAMADAMIQRSNQ